MQRKQPEWTWQWNEFQDDSLWLFQEWIAPNALEDFRGKDALDCGCGGGQHLTFIAPICRSAVGVDLNATEAARKRTARFPNVEVREADIATMDLHRQFDIVYAIGVLHHTDDPEKSFRNIVRHCRPGGRVVVWVYSHEGNFWNRTLVEWSKAVLIRFLPRGVVRIIARTLTLLLTLPIYTLYRFTPRSLGVARLPFYEYFAHWRKLSFSRNLLNVFDKLNAPRTFFIRRSDVQRWFTPEQFTDVHVSPFLGVSWRASGTKR